MEDVLLVLILVNVGNHNMSDNSIQNLIRESFLSDDEKQSLLQYLSTKGDDQEFYDTFDRYLADGLIKVNNVYTDTMTKLDNELDQLDKEINLQKENLKTALNNKLGQIKPSDIKNKQVIWDDYYKSIDKLQKEQEEKIKEMLSSKMVAAM